MIPTLRSKVIEAEKAEEKKEMDLNQILCSECNKKLFDKPRKNCVTDRAVYLILKKNSSEYLPYCSQCASSMPAKFIDKMETYDVYQKKVKAGII